MKRVVLFSCLFSIFFGSEDDWITKGYDAYRKKEYGEAVKFFGIACDNKDSYACFILGGMYDSGDGAKKDRKKALEFYTKACNEGSAPACYILKQTSQNSKK